MSCSPFDLRDYYFKELGSSERRATEVHVKTCAACHEELERLRGTETALLALPDEDIPQRIGFVSDPVFQPSALQRGWRAFWGSAARLGFASAAMLSAALLFFSVTRPAVQANHPAPAVTQTAAGAKLDQQVRDAVSQAVAESEARQARQTRDLLAASDKRHALETQAMQVRFDEFLEVERKRQTALMMASVQPNETAGEQR